MISIYQLKPRFQALLRPIARSCAIAGITANMVTVAAMLVSQVRRQRRAEDAALEEKIAKAGGSVTEL